MRYPFLQQRPVTHSLTHSGFQKPSTHTNPTTHHLPSLPPHPSPPNPSTQTPKDPTPPSQPSPSKPKTPCPTTLPPPHLTSPTSLPPFPPPHYPPPLPTPPTSPPAPSSQKPSPHPTTHRAACKTINHIRVSPTWGAVGTNTKGTVAAWEKGRKGAVVKYLLGDCAGGGN